MKDATDTGRPNLVRQGSSRGRKCSYTARDAATAGFSLRECRKGQERGVKTIDGLFAGRRTHLSLKPVVRHECKSIK